MSLSFSLNGGAALQAKLAQIAKKLPEEVGRAMYEEMLIESKESQRRTPVEFGALRASHEVSKPDMTGNNISVSIAVGGPSAPYALWVHELLDNFHAVGQAKFLESTLLESAPHMASRIASRVDLNKAT